MWHGSEVNLVQSGVWWAVWLWWPQWWTPVRYVYQIWRMENFPKNVMMHMTQNIYKKCYLLKVRIPLWKNIIKFIHTTWTKDKDRDIFRNRKQYVNILSQMLALKPPSCIMLYTTSRVIPMKTLHVHSICWIKWCIFPPFPFPFSPVKDHCFYVISRWSPDPSLRKFLPENGDISHLFLLRWLTFTHTYRQLSDM